MILDHSKLLVNGNVNFHSFCENPQIVYNKYIGDYTICECRKCQACYNRRAERLARLISMECAQHPYNIFFTLTYDNDSIPCLELSDTKDYYEKNRLDKNGYHLVVDDVQAVDAPFIRKRLKNNRFKYIYGKVGIVDVRDVQLFMKRLRKRIFSHVTSIPEEERTIRYFISSEYGPNSFRPHYHGIIFCDSKEIADCLLTSRLGKDGECENFIYQSWQMCDFEHIKPSVIKHDASRYVTSYFGQFARLPKILQHKCFKPFYVCSRKPYIGFSKVDEESWLGRLISGDIKDIYTDPKTLGSSYVPISVSVLSHFFPLPSGVRNTNNRSQLSLYYKYAHGDFTKESKYNYLTPHGNLGDLSPLGMHHLTDAYNYQDFRFARALSFWCNKTRRYKEFSDGLETGNTFEVSLSPERYIELLDNLYKQLSYFNLCRDFYKRDLINKANSLNSEFKRICEFYNLSPTRWADFFHHPKPFMLLPEYVTLDDGFVDFFYKEFAGLEFCGIADLYDVVCSPQSEHLRLHLRTDLVNYIIYKNPNKQKEKQNLDDIVFKKTCRKLHLSRFNQSF